MTTGNVPPRMNRVLTLFAVGWLVGSIILFCSAWGVRYTGFLDAPTPPTTLSTMLGMVYLVWTFSIPAIGLLLAIKHRNAAWGLAFGVELGLAICCGLIFESKLG
jgi:hypothetical protein